jgi:hypothetical protein
VHDSQAAETLLDTPRPPLAVTADKAYDSKKVQQQIRDDGAFLSSPAATMLRRKPTAPTHRSTPAHDRELLLRYQGLAKDRDQIRQACSDFLTANNLVGPVYWARL